MVIGLRRLLNTDEATPQQPAHCYPTTMLKRVDSKTENANWSSGLLKFKKTPMRKPGEISGKDVRKLVENPGGFVCAFG